MASGEIRYKRNGTKVQTIIYAGGAGEKKKFFKSPNFTGITFFQI